MIRHLIRAVVFLTLAASASFAQTTSATTGAITGTVTDSSSGTLPGVTVSLSGASMMGVQNAVTGTDGAYRFIALPPGEYKLSFELTGFSTIVRDAVRIPANFTATINVQMGVAALEEAVTVTGASPVVDVTSTSIATTFDKETLANLPSARDYWAVLSEAPGVKMQRIDVGGAAAGTQTGYFVYGTTGQVRPMVEGINSTEGNDAFGNYVDYGSFEEIQIGSGASSAESPVPGVFTQLVSKSGGNTYHGAVYLDKEWQGFQSYNIDDEQVARGVTGGGGLEPRDTNRLSNYSDKNADIGGFLKKDKIWWYASVRGLDSSVRYTNYPVEPHRTELRNFTTKWTYQLSQNNKLIGYYGPSSKTQPTRLDRHLLGGTTAIHQATNDSFTQSYAPYLWKAEWNSIITPATFFEVRTGAFAYDWLDTPTGDGVSYEDLNTNLVSGRARSRDYLIARNQILGSLSYVKGSHSLKIGAEWFRETQTAYRFADSYNGVLHVLRSGSPSEVLFFEPAASENGLYVFGNYVQDTWKAANRLTINMGFRSDYYRNFLPEQIHEAGPFTPTAITYEARSNINSFWLPAPRLGVTYALTEDNKTILKGNYGFYWWNPGATLSSNVNPNQEVWFRRYVWTDLNGDRIWQEGEQGGSPTSVGGGTASQAIDPNLKDTYTQELAGWLERELLPNFGVRTGVVWRGERNLAQAYNTNRQFSDWSVPFSARDPGPDGVVNTPDDGGTFTVYNLTPEALARGNVNTYTNVPGAKNDYYTFEITGTKRMSDHWSGLLSYTYTWSGRNDRTFFGTNFRQNNLPVTPNDLINTEPDGKIKYTDWSLKLNGTYEGPWGLKISPMLRTQAGANFGRVFNVTTNGGTFLIPAEPLNTRRQDLIAVFDFRAEKVVGLPGGVRVAPFIDAYNLFNSNAEQNIIWTSGASFLRPTSIIPPRIARLGFKLNW